jgi:C_GCAxxG_C_C family probable redox protein
MTDCVSETALDHFKSGLYCAESVLLALAKHQEIESDLLPAIATGFCGGQSRTGGQCGAVAGALMGLGLAFGRNRSGETVDQAYRATTQFLQRFEAEFGSSNCSVLLGCHLGTADGQAAFKNGNLVEKCLAYSARAAQIAAELIDESEGKTK